MANRRPQQNNGRRIDFGRPDRKNFGRPPVSPWQNAGPNPAMSNMLNLGGGGSTEATLALATNLIQMLQPRQNPVPSLLDMPVRRDFVPNMGPGRFNQGGFMPPNRMGMGNPNFRRTGYNNRPNDRPNNNQNRNRNQQKPQQNKSSPKKEADSKSKTVAKESGKEEKEKKENESDGKTESTKGKNETKKASSDNPNTKYDDISSALLKCHICNKSMWDGRSFENHLSGRAHAIMMQKTAESYALTADTMRQEFKIREMKRTRKTGAHSSRDFYCAMCDMYAADGAIHRTTVGHRKLKKYLHPGCLSCHKEMPTRIELDEHRLTAEHLRNIQSKQEVVLKPKPEVMVISTLAMEQTYVRDDRNKRRSGGTSAEAKEGQDGDAKMETEGEENQKAEGEKEVDKKPAPADREDTVLDYKEGDDLSGITKAQWPQYNPERGVGRSFLEELHCVQCRLCHKLLDSEETAEVHLRTWKHHQLFLRKMMLYAPATKKEDQQSEGAQKTKRSPDDGESGSGKRRRINDSANDEGEEMEAEANGEVDGEDGLGEEANGEVDGDGDADMPAAEELEDWDEDPVAEDADVTHVEEQAEPEEEQMEAEQEKQEEEVPELEPEEVKPVEEEEEPEVDKPEPRQVTATRNTATRSRGGSPRGSPRGRARGRGKR